MSLMRVGYVERWFSSRFIVRFIVFAVSLSFEVAVLLFQLPLEVLERRGYTVEKGGRVRVMAAELEV